MRPSRSVQRLSSGVGTALLASAVAACVATTLVGCVPPPKPAAPPPPAPPVPTASDVTQTQQQFAAQDPHARVGRVASVKVDSHLAAVGGIPFADVKQGDPISFTGPDHDPFATGTIIDLDNHTDPKFPLLIVDYQKGSGNGRDPSVGDLAITVPMGH